MDFENFKFAIEVYEFAQKMSIKPLMKALDQFFDDLPEAVVDICDIFDSYQLAGNKLAIHICKKVRISKFKGNPNFRRTYFFNSIFYTPPKKFISLPKKKRSTFKKRPWKR